MDLSNRPVDFTIIFITFNNSKSIGVLIRRINEIFFSLRYTYEIIVVDANSQDDTMRIALEEGAKAFIQSCPGYGNALREGFEKAAGRYIITMDSDASHNPYIVKRLINNRDATDIIIASRYVRGGVAQMPLVRRICSGFLNRFLSFALSIPVHDISSGFRLYRKDIFEEIDFREADYSVLIEILIKAYMNGFRVKEVPFHYRAELNSQRYNAKIIKIGFSFLHVLFKMWRMRNTVFSADYDDRAFHSRIPMQRFWHRQKYKIISDFIEDFPSRMLDVGCGTCKVLGAFPQAVGLDISFKKLRYNLSLGNPLVLADLKNLCFRDSSFDALICSQVIEHIEGGDSVLLELSRVIKKDGTLILGTPDYSRWSWVLIEKIYKLVIPGGYADEHVTHYTRKRLVKLLEPLGFNLVKYKYILGSDLICKFRKVA